MRDILARGRIAALVVTLAAAAVAVAATAAARMPTPRTVPCDEIILQHAAPPGDYRIALDGLAVPPRYMRKVYPSGNGRWPWWRKNGLVVRAGTGPVTVTVPRPWRGRAAIRWGNNTGIVSSLRIARCTQEEQPWNAYAGGFLLRSRSACIPVIFRIGNETATVRFGIGRHCGG